MVRLRHPRALSDVAGHPPRTIPSDAVGERVTVDDAGEFAIDDPDDARDLAAAYDLAVTDLLVDAAAERDDIPDAIAAGVCPWCPPDERYEGEHVGQHASSAHPEAWDAYNGGDA